MNAASISLTGGLLSVGIALIVGSARPSWAGWAAAVAASAVAAGVAVAWSSGATVLIDVAWIPVIHSRFALSLDPLGAPLALFISAMAAPVFVYTVGYLPHHLKKKRRPLREQARFCRLLLGFMLAMLLVVTAQDLLVLFGALELTALASFLLIEFDQKDYKARAAALLALLVTAGSSLLYLAGLLLIATRHGTTYLPDLLPTDVSTLAAALIVAGVIAKSAQVPFHFWLPRAMVAPTPVSAYLHSAALVAAGVFVLQRLRPMLDGSAAVLTALLVIGFSSIFLGGVLALISDGMKRVLAYSTVAQYGYASVLIALGGADGNFGAPFFLVAHGICKAALFMTAGAVTQTTGARKLSETGALLRTMPGLAAASGIAAAGLAGLPGTIGYFKDELLFAAGAHHGPVLGALTVTAAALTAAYVARFWWSIFLPARAPDGHRPDTRLSAPVWVFAAAVITGGFWTGPLETAFARAAGEIGQAAEPVHLAYDLSKKETAMAFAAWSAGLVLFLTRRAWERRLRHAVIKLSYGVGPARWSDRLAAAVPNVSSSLYRFELRDLRDRVGIVLLPTGALLLLGVYTSGALPASAGPIRLGDAPVVVGLAAASTAAVAAARAGRLVPMILLLSFAGYGLALTFVLSGAPDVALVMAMTETALTLLLLAVLWQFRTGIYRETQRGPASGPRGPWLSIAGGFVAFFLSWFAMSVPQPEVIAWSYVELAQSAHAKDVVTAILADFRGLDTAGEITVVAVAVFGAAAIAWERST